MEIRFSQEAIYKIAALAEKMNTEMENIGARRLHTMIEQLLEDISFTAPERQGDVIEIDTLFVEERLSPLMEDTDLRKYLL
ncbi:ATP-dependent protease ATPase subunit ClpY [bioreactor metagenome]|uniref:ATP-dependent protease ATPase subunit ClpY n=1 Tax=bioreactor metagenome TaxID=1076179 RepID=A0A645FIA5_9ZZZZ